MAHPGACGIGPTSSKPALFYVAIPGWDSKEIIRLPLDLVPYRRRRLIEPGFRFFASVNKGAEQPEALFFTKFEFPLTGNQNDRTNGFNIGCRSWKLCSAD